MSILINLITLGLFFGTLFIWLTTIRESLRVNAPDQTIWFIVTFVFGYPVGALVFLFVNPTGKNKKLSNTWFAINHKKILYAYILMLALSFGFSLIAGFLKLKSATI